MIQSAKLSKNFVPKWLESVFVFFPLIHFLIISLSSIAFIQSADFLHFILIPISIYIVPLLTWRCLALLYPLEEGTFEVGVHCTKGNSWMLNHRIQYLFFTFQFFEKILIIIPGAFSLWLRLWGSQIGKKIVWTPRVEILDRSLLSIGDSCFFGDQVCLSAHTIVRRKGRLCLFVKKIHIGSRNLVGFKSDLGPGSFLKENSFVPASSKIFYKTNLQFDLKSGHYFDLQKNKSASVTTEMESE